jgi:putative resolvase
MPVPARKLASGTIWVDVGAPQEVGRTVVYARVSSHDQKADLDRQVARVTQWVTAQKMSVGEVVTEVGSGLNGKRTRLRRLLADPAASVIVVEHRDRLARFGVEYLEASLAATGRKVLIVDEGEVEDDLVRDMTEVLTLMCARLYGRRGAKNRAKRALECASKPLDGEQVSDA